MMRLLLLAAVVLSGAPVDARKAAGRDAVRAARRQWKSKFYGTFVLNHRIILHAISSLICGGPR